MNTGSRSRCKGRIILVAWDKLCVLTKNECPGDVPILGKIVKVVVLFALLVCMAMVATVPSGLSTSSSILASGGTVRMDLIRITRFSSVFPVPVEVEALLVLLLLILADAAVGGVLFSKSACSFSKFLEIVCNTSIGTAYASSSTTTLPGVFGLVVSSSIISFPLASSTTTLIVVGSEFVVSEVDVACPEVEGAVASSAKSSKSLSSFPVLEFEGGKFKKKFKIKMHGIFSQKFREIDTRLWTRQDRSNETCFGDYDESISNHLFVYLVVGKRSAKFKIPFSKFSNVWSPIKLLCVSSADPNKFEVDDDVIP